MKQHLKYNTIITIVSELNCSIIICDTSKENHIKQTYIIIHTYTCNIFIQLIIILYLDSTRAARSLDLNGYVRSSNLTNSSILHIKCM